MERMTTYETWSYVEHVLKDGVLAEAGKMAAIELSSAEITKGGSAVGLRAIGYFDETKTGDGVVTVRVRLFREVYLHWWKNDTATPVVAADFGSPCYILDDETVTGDSAGASTAGVVWGVSNTLGVLVEMDGFGAG